MCSTVAAPLHPGKMVDPFPWMKTPSWTNVELAKPRMRPSPLAGQLPSCGNLLTDAIVKWKQVVPEDLGEGPGCLIMGVITGSRRDPAQSQAVLMKDRIGASLETGCPSWRQSLGIPDLCASYPEPRQGLRDQTRTPGPATLSLFYSSDRPLSLAVWTQT